MPRLPTQKTSTEILPPTHLPNPPAVCLQALSLVSDSDLRQSLSWSLKMPVLSVLFNLRHCQCLPLPVDRQWTHEKIFLDKHPNITRSYSLCSHSLMLLNSFKCSARFSNFFLLVDSISLSLVSELLVFEGIGLVSVSQGRLSVISAVSRTGLVFQS